MGWSFRGSFLWLLFLLVAGTRVSAQDSAPPPPLGATLPLSKIPRVHRAPKLADFLEDRPREAELAVSDFREYQPGDGIPATESTTTYLSYDEKNLYVVFVCHDQPGQIRAHLSKREDLDHDDGVGVYLDTFRDRHRAYFFFSNPLGIQADAIYTEGTGTDFSFDTVWHNEGRLTKDGYIVWFSVPFKSLRFSHEPEQTWGIALYRAILRKNEYDYWPYITQRVEGMTQQFAPAGGLEQVSPGRNMQFIPYGLLANNHFLDQPASGAPGFHDVFEHRAGLDAKFVLKDAVTFDVTLNPDFSQVESDDPQVTVNQRFAVFFPEKRPFFIENAGFFATSINLFFSRQIADPKFGARLTGKLGQWTFGALVIDDRQPGEGFSSGPYATRAADGVVRVTHEFGKQSFIGAFVSSRDFADTHNRVTSLDARLKFSKNWVLDLQAAHSWTRQDTNLSQACQSPDQHLQGGAYWANLSYIDRHFTFASDYDEKTPGFCTELGFVNRVDIRQHYSFAGYFWRPKKSLVLDFGPTATELLNWDHSGRLQDWQANLGFQVDLRKQTTLNISRGEAMELFDGINFRKHSTAALFSTEPYKWLALNARLASGTGVNYYPATSLPAPFLGDVKKLSLGFTLRPSSRLRFDETYLYYRLGTRQDATPPGSTPGQSIFNNHLMRSKFHYQFTKEFSLRLILDYNATLANSQLLDLQSNLGNFVGVPVLPSKRFTPDVLFTYLLHPGTALYAGYSDDYTNLAINPSAPYGVALQHSPNNATGRLFFVKLSYLFRF